MRRFKDEFFKDDTGRSRHWPDIEEAKIKELFDVAKARVSALLEQFRKVAIPVNLTEMQTPNPDSPFQTNGLI